MRCLPCVAGFTPVRACLGPLVAHWRTGLRQLCQPVTLLHRAYQFYVRRLALSVGKGPLVRTPSTPRTGSVSSLHGVTRSNIELYALLNNGALIPSVDLFGKADVVFAALATGTVSGEATTFFDAGLADLATYSASSNQIPPQLLRSWYIMYFQICRATHRGKIEL